MLLLLLIITTVKATTLLLLHSILSRPPQPTLLPQKPILMDNFMQDQQPLTTDTTCTPDYPPLTLSCHWTYKRRNSKTGLFVPIAHAKNLFTNYGLIQVAGALSTGAQSLYLVIESFYATIQTALSI